MRLLMFIAILLVSQSTSAACPDNSKYGRKCFNKENAPPALVYRIFVRGIFVDSLDYLEDLDSLDDNEYHAGWHFVEAGVTPNMRSADVVRYFVTRFLDMEKEAEELQKRMLCLDGKPRYEGAENFLIFNQLEEASLNVYEKHLLLAQSDLQASGLFDLDKALKEYPGSFSSTFMDHRKAHEGSIKRIYEAAAALCKAPWGHSFGSSVSVNEDQAKIQ